MTRQRKRLYIGFSIYFIIVLIFTVYPPLVASWNRLYPHILGLPFAQFSVIVFAILLIAGLLTWFILEGKLNEKETTCRKSGEPLDH